VEWAGDGFEFSITGNERGPADGRWQGLSEARKGLGNYLGAFEDLRPEVEEYREIDAERVLVLSHPVGRGKTSGLELDHELLRSKGAQLFHIKGGKVTRIVHYRHRERAFSELGLSPSGS
jgi:hypothetical protein